MMPGARILAVLAASLLASPAAAGEEARGVYPLVDLLARERPAEDAAGYPRPVHVSRLALSGEDGWTSDFNDEWRAGAAFPGPFLQEFSEGLEWYLRARGFRLGAGPGAVHVKVTFTEFEGRRKTHSVGGDLRARVQITFAKESLADEVLFETGTYLDAAGARRELSRKLGLGPVPFDTVLFYRLSRGMFASITDHLLESAPLLPDRRDAAGGHEGE